MKIAIIDTIGLVYNSQTIHQRGLGGSESAVVYMAQHLSEYDGVEKNTVTVFNNCDDGVTTPEIVSPSLSYVPVQTIGTYDEEFDVVIVSRTVHPFHPQNAPFVNIMKKAKHKVLWLHDTFCQGDELLEDLVVHGFIDEVFVLSDFHLSYITTCDHGKRRNFEVLKNKIFMTRNGAVAHTTVDEHAILNKDPNHFVFNASVTKGMVPLVERVWPLVKARIPLARLTVIGGYYTFREGAEPDQQEKDWRAMVAREDLKALDITFTGVIPQKQISEILANASVMLYPGLFPETYGISTLEALIHNVPVVTTRFGALEEVAIDSACYKIDYAIGPNSLFPQINEDQQVQLLAHLATEARTRSYLFYQKQRACNAVKDIASWETISWQWMQHFCQTVKKIPISVREFERVSRINQRVIEVFGRRFLNKEDRPQFTALDQVYFEVIVPFYNSKEYLARCAASIAAQRYTNAHVTFINDASTDATPREIDDIIAEQFLAYKNPGLSFTIVHNKTRVGALQNQLDIIRRTERCYGEDFIILIDGDDCLAPDNTIFQQYNAKIQNNEGDFFYGSMWSMADNIPLIAQEYPISVKANKTYKDHAAMFPWKMPYTHLRVFDATLVPEIDDQFLDDDGNVFMAGGDAALFYATIKNAINPRAVTDIVYYYNDMNPLNDYKVNGDEQTRNSNKITGIATTPMQTKKILLAIPTAKNIEAKTFKSIYDLEVPDGYEVDFQYFYGYNIDQVRNLIAAWAKDYSYLFSVDSDIVLPKDTLKKMLAHNVDVVSGVYIQRIPGTATPEIYRKRPNGAIENVRISELSPIGLQEIDGCGFGCVLVKSYVLDKIGYPQFTYKSALDHKDTVSEDVDFCMKAKRAGFKIFADSSITCEHVGSGSFIVPNITEARLRELSQQRLLPVTHRDYLPSVSDLISPVVYDIGACVLHWTNEARQVWPQGKFYAFEAMDEPAFLYQEQNIPYHCGVLSDQVKIVNFYKNVTHPGGNSYYQENADVNPEAPLYFNENHKVLMKTNTLDSVVRERNWPLPDIIKMDTQGSELDIMRGGLVCIANATDIIVEAQITDYNKNAPKFGVVESFLREHGFELVNVVTNTLHDADYHFRRAKEL